MLNLTKYLWGSPSAFRIAASLALGAVLAICTTGTPVWLLVLGFCLILRTHILSLFAGLATGYFFKTLLVNLYEPAGKMILLSDKNFWESILSKPIICYLNLNIGRVMGNFFVAIICGMIIFTFLFPILTIIRNHLMQRSRKIPQLSNNFYKY